MFRVVFGNMEKTELFLSPPLYRALLHHCAFTQVGLPSQNDLSCFCSCSHIKIHKGVLLVSGYSGCLAWPARDLKTDFGAQQPELVGCTIQHYPMKLYLADISLTPSFSHQLAKVAYSVPATASLHVSACLLTR